MSQPSTFTPSCRGGPSGRYSYSPVERHGVVPLYYETVAFQLKKLYSISKSKHRREHFVEFIQCAETGYDENFLDSLKVSSCTSSKIKRFLIYRAKHYDNVTSRWELSTFAK